MLSKVMRALQASTEFVLKDESLICIGMAEGGGWDTDYSFLKSSFQTTFNVWKKVLFECTQVRSQVLHVLLSRIDDRGDLIFSLLFQGKIEEGRYKHINTRGALGRASELRENEYLFNILNKSTFSACVSCKYSTKLIYCQKLLYK